MSTQHQGLAGGMAGNKPATRPGVIPLSIKEKSALLAAYMPFLENGGLFVPTDKSAQLGDELYIILTLMDDATKTAIPGRVAWVTRCTFCEASSGFSREWVAVSRHSSSSWG